MSTSEGHRIRRYGGRYAAHSVWLGAIVVSLQQSAAAQTGEAVAESLYRDGKRLFQVDDFEHACPKLAQSYQIDPAGGTVLLLAICYEKQGKLASAWARYNDALALAKRDQREDRERRAREGLSSVEPKLSYIDLKIDPATQAIAGVALAIDGTELPAISDVKLPIDAGKHKLAIYAPNYQTWSAEITVGGPSATQAVTVPALEPAPPALPMAAPPPIQGTSPAVASPSPARERAHNKNMRTWAYVVGGAGLATVGVGSYFGIKAIGLKNDADAICSTQQCTQAQAAAIRKSEDALSKARVADALIGIGSAVTISALVMWYVYRSDPPATEPYAVVLPHALSLGWRQSF